MNEPLVLTFDIGTQSARGLLVTKKGEFIDKEQVRYNHPYFSKKPGWAEQKHDYYFDKICEISKILLERNKDKLSDISAVTITTIRDTVLCLDKDNKPLRDIILWLDNRKASYDNHISIAKKALFHSVGMGESIKILYKATAANWICQNQPEIWAKTKKYIMLSTYMNFLLTGEMKDCAANMIGHIPFDYRKKKWLGKHDLTRCICDIPEEKLCELISTGEIIGRITEKASILTGIPMGIPLIATGSDKGCETLGLSVIKNNQAAISFGTTATIQMAVNEYFEPQPFMPAYPAVPNDMYNPEIEIYRGFWLVTWFIKEFAGEDKAEAREKGCSAEKLLDEKIKSIMPGSDGLVLQPFWTPGITNPNALGAVVGFSDFHTRYHLYRAIIEGICFELFQSMLTMQKRSGIEIKEIFVGGGGAKSDIVCQITADIFGLPVKRTQTYESCSIGSAMVAFVAQGIYSDYEEAIKNMVVEKDVFYPDSKNHNHYMLLYRKVYSKIYPRIKRIDKNIMKIYKRR